VEEYAAHLREHGAPPPTVFQFCQRLGITEKEFFGQFGSFDAVESAFWHGALRTVGSAVERGPEWAGFGARQRVLAFLFAFAEESLGWRSLLLARLGGCSARTWPRHLRGLEDGYGDFLRAVLDYGRSSGEIPDRGLLNQAYEPALALHFRAVVDFHLRDTSEGFQRTDAFIEKSTNLAFDLMGRQAADSAVELARFLLQRPA
jgi:hypothetical protein